MQMKKYRLAGLAVAPGRRDNRPTEPANDGLEGQFDGEIKMRRDERPAAVDGRLAIGLEGVGRVVEPDV